MYFMWCCLVFVDIYYNTLQCLVLFELCVRHPLAGLIPVEYDAYYTFLKGWLVPGLYTASVFNMTIVVLLYIRN